MDPWDLMITCMVVTPSDESSVPIVEIQGARAVSADQAARSSTRTILWPTPILNRFEGPNTTVYHCSSWGKVNTSVNLGSRY
ncbi:hypothetical protein SAICODRAFT_211419 [Saitoella complicata NRRL Y-17804]|uniref:uncharacterized protein n=1 Tax=Saitoella complicata (strain BCRC 22490 / CBS 7301 / JCM 7358 / NBRC 10748 / NRRL Y-17804) TaxID=698492 RepID=UPI000866F9AB|nr:uncharacterized protein SAICODRAFT_211419 [Saitoella complicata NRRL Y-17804]ODQ54490.1 hypothetical protein SAICODRAFT_211419 [Saitoella complicata NRRL Y-17804]